MSLKKWKKTANSESDAMGKAQRMRNKWGFRTPEPLLPNKQITVLNFPWQEIDEHIWNNKNLWVVSKADGESLCFRISLKFHPSWQKLANRLKDELLPSRSGRKHRNGEWSSETIKADRDTELLVNTSKRYEVTDIATVSNMKFKVLKNHPPPKKGKITSANFKGLLQF